MPLYMPLAYTMWNFPWRFKPKPVNIHAITFSSPHPQHHPQCTSPDVEEVEREGDVGEGDALKPFLNCHDFPWKPIEGKPSLKLMIHWLEVAFLPFHVLLFVHLVRHQICAIFLNSGGNIIIHLEKQPFQDRALPLHTRKNTNTKSRLTVIYRVSQKKCNIAIFSLNLFQRSDYTFSHVLRNQNFEPVRSKPFKHTYSEY